MIKKIVLIALVMFVLSLPSIGGAATVGNIAETQGAAGKFSIGVEYDGVTNRDLKWKSGTWSETIVGTTSRGSIPSAGGSIEDMQAESNRIFLKGTVGIHPNVDVFVKIGMADADWKMTEKEIGNPDYKWEFNGDRDLAYGIGAKAKVFQTLGGLRVMADAQYLHYEVDGKLKGNGKDYDQNYLAYLRGYDPSVTFSSTQKTKVQEWQIALYVNQTIGNFSPYGGVKYSAFKADFEFDGSGQFLGEPLSVKIDGKSEADNNLGIFLGTDIYLIPNKFSVNVEGRFIDETAFTVGANYRF